MVMQNNERGMWNMKFVLHALAIATFEWKINISVRFWTSYHMVVLTVSCICRTAMCTTVSSVTLLPACCMQMSACGCNSGSYASLSTTVS